MYVLISIFITYVFYVIYHNISAFVNKLKSPSSKVFFQHSNKHLQQKLYLHSRENISHDTVIFRFNLPKMYISGLPLGKHINVFAPQSKINKPAIENLWNGDHDSINPMVDHIQRSYAPISKYEDPFIELVIKVYAGDKTQNSNYPDGGKMSQYLNTLQIGDAIDVSGPFGSHEYINPGALQTGNRIIQFNKLGLIAAGTGITPMLQIITKILQDPNDHTEISLIFANKSENDILMREEIDMLSSISPSQFEVWYTLDKPPTDNWKYDKGFVTKQMISQHLPKPNTNTAIFICGPPLFIKHACKSNLTELGYSNVYSW